jgi:peptidoglycan/xylan/chitin deacetylase (PgdA/CDA1 family)
MPESEAFRRAARRAAERRSGARRRERRRRRRAARRLTALAAAAIVATVLALLAGGGGSRVHTRAPSTVAATTPTGPATTPTGPATTPTGPAKTARAQVATALPGYAESGEVRSLVSLGRPIYCAGSRGNEVALTFDDGPGPYTRLVLAKLRKHGVRATFFIVGRNIALVPGATAEERVLGAVGDHTFTHPLLTALTPGEAEREIVRTQTAVASSSGGPVFMFRPPYGARNPTIDGIVRAHGLLQILWTVDSADSLGADYAQIERNVIGGLRPGAIILMHENHGQTVRALLNIFAALKRKHLRAVSVAQLLTDDPPSVAQVRAGGAACGVHGRAARSGS